MHRWQQSHPILCIFRMDAHLPHLHNCSLCGLHEQQPHQDTIGATQAILMISIHICCKKKCIENNGINQDWIISILIPNVGGNFKDSTTSFLTLARNIAYSPGKIYIRLFPAFLNSPFSLKFIFVNYLSIILLTLRRDQSQISCCCQPRYQRQCRHILLDGRIV